MSSVFVGLQVSTLATLVLVVLFWIEKRRGTRFGERFRAHADYYVLRAQAQAHIYVERFTQGYLRQIVHYLFHTILRTVLEMMRRAEKKIHETMRANKTLAKRAERESATRSKLEEIAIHKAKHALTEDEKRIKRVKSLHEENPL